MEEDSRRKLEVQDIEEDLEWLELEREETLKRRWFLICMEMIILENQRHLELE